MNSEDSSGRMAAGDGDARDVSVDVGERMKRITSKVDSKIYFHKDVMIEYMEMKGVISDLVEEKKKVEQERWRVKEDLADAREKLALRSQQLDEKEEDLGAVRQQLAQRNDELVEKNDELMALRLKLQEMETMKFQTEDGNAANSAPNQVQTTRRWTRSKQQKKRKLSGHFASRDDDLEVLREKLIKGFMELAGPRRNLGVKEIGKLNEKPFQDACAAKLPPKEAEAAASKLYYAWEKLLDDPSWKPMIGRVGGDYQDEVIDVVDEKLQKLRREWGEGPYKSVVNTLVEREEYNFDGTLAYDLWNYKEGRKATLGECIDYLLDQVEQLTILCRKYRKSGVMS